MHISSYSWDDVTLAHVTALLKDDDAPLPFSLNRNDYKSDRDGDRNLVRTVLRWIRGTFSVTADGSGGGRRGRAHCPPSSSLVPAALVLVLHQPPPHVASSWQLCLLLHALLMALGLRARLVYSLDPCPAAASASAGRGHDVHAEKRRRFDDNYRSDEDVAEREQLVSGEEDEEEEDEEEGENVWAGTSLPVAVWVEVLLPPSSARSSCSASPTRTDEEKKGVNWKGGEDKTGFVNKYSTTGAATSWVNVDPVRNVIGNKALVEQKCRVRSTSVCYVIAVTSPSVLELLLQDRHDRGSGLNWNRRRTTAQATGPGPCGCGVQDITFNYATNPSRTRQKRLKHKDDLDWWRTFQKSFLREDVSSSSSSSSSRRSDSGAVAHPEDEGEDSVLGILPTSKSGFKHHPRYVLKPHLSDRQVLCGEAKPVGVFSGLLIYRRRDVVELKSKYEWSQLKRVVRIGEPPWQVRDGRRKDPFNIACSSTEAREDVVLERDHQWPASSSSSSSSSSPLSLSSSLSSASSASASASSSSSSSWSSSVAASAPQTLQLYAESQTVAQSAPQLLDGTVPRNEHGNIAIWGGDLSLVPQGAVYIESQFASVAARELGIPAVEALVGFQERLVYNQALGQRVSRQVPVLEGVVVLQHVAQLVEDAALTLEASAAQQQKEVRWKRICNKWHRVVGSLTLRAQLRQAYGA